MEPGRALPRRGHAGREPILAVEGGVSSHRNAAASEREYARTLERASPRLANLGHRPAASWLVGEPVVAITAHARKVAADLIVVGHKQHEGWAAAGGAGSPRAR